MASFYINDSLEGHLEVASVNYDFCIVCENKFIGGTTSPENHLNGALQKASHHEQNLTGIAHAKQNHFTGLLEPELFQECHP